MYIRKERPMINSREKCADNFVYVDYGALICFLFLYSLTSISLRRLRLSPSLQMVLLYAR